MRATAKRSEWSVPVYTPSLANQRLHWAARARQARAQRDASHRAALVNVPRAWAHTVAAAGVVVLLVRCSPRPLDDDNLRAALKSVRDGIADALGMDDRDPRVVWEYGQERAKVPAVRVVATLRERAA